MLSGDNSLLTKAEDAKTSSENAKAREELQLAITATSMDYYTGNKSGTLRDYLFSSEGQNKINNNLEEDAIFDSDNYQITYKKVTFNVAEDGTLSIGTKLGEDDSIEYDELPDDFWIANNGVAYINTKYIDATANSNVDSYGSYGSSGSTSTVGNCQYTKLTVPSSINGQSVTKFSVENVNNIVALNIQEGIIETPNISTIKDTLQDIKIPNSVTLDRSVAGDYVNYAVTYKDMNHNNTYVATNGWRILYRTREIAGANKWNIKIVSTDIPARVSIR